MYLLPILRNCLKLSILAICMFTLTSSCPLTESCDCQHENCVNLAIAAYYEEAAECWWWQTSCFDQARANEMQAMNNCSQSWAICMMIAAGM